MTDLMSRPYEPNESKCCEACVFGRGAHATWCEARLNAWMTVHRASEERMEEIDPLARISGHVARWREMMQMPLQRVRPNDSRP